MQYLMKGSYDYICIWKLIIVGALSKVILSKKINITNERKEIDKSSKEKCLNIINWSVT